METLFSSHYGVIRFLLGQKDKSPSSVTLNASINSLEKWFTMNCHLSSPIFPNNLPPVVLPCGLAQRGSILSFPDVMQTFWWLLALCNCSCGGEGRAGTGRLREWDSQGMESLLVLTVPPFSYCALQRKDCTVWSCPLRLPGLPLQWCFPPPSCTEYANSTRLFPGEGLVPPPCFPGSVTLRWRLKHWIFENWIPSIPYSGSGHKSRCHYIAANNSAETQACAWGH